MRALSIAKLEEGLVNEDAAIAKDTLIAVSDGAGGGGVFADKWSKYLVSKISDEPISDYQSFDNWIDVIWEPFYNDYEEIAKREGGMLLNKFYDEGSFATLVVVWKSGQWVSYGDSVAFCYNPRTGLLQHSFGRLVDFNNPPYLINCKDPLCEKGFKAGKFDISPESIVFVASDTLSHYILMAYEVANKDKYADELQEAIDAQTKDSQFINVALSQDNFDFEKNVLNKLLNCKSWVIFKTHIKKLRRQNLIGHDDYSIAFL